MRRMLGTCCDWSAVTDVTGFDFDTGQTFAVSLALLRSWQGNSVYAKTHWNIPDDARQRYQLTLRTAETWFTVNVLVRGDDAYVMAFDSFTAGTDVQHPCAAIRMPVAALGL
jgi:hypothetical protein